MQRRDFLAGVVTVLSGIVTALLSTPVVAYFMRPAFAGKRRQWVEISSLSAIPSGAGPHRLDYLLKRRDGWVITKQQRTAFLMREGDGSFVIFSSTCTHLGCSVSWNQEKRRFVCPCHGGEFDRSGLVVQEPPPKPLERLTYKTVSGKLFIQVEV